MSKMKYGSFMTYSLIILTIFGLVSADLSKIKYQKCEQTGLKLECNHIPREIPHNVIRVHIIDWFGNSDSEGTPSERICNERTFLSNTWKQVKILEINDPLTEESQFGAIQLQSKCFFPLKELQELHLHLENFDILENAFVGLDQLRLLDFRGCSRLEITQLNKALRGPNKTPNLSEISLSHAGYLRQSLILDKEFADALSDKPVKKIDVSDTQITLLNIVEILTKMKQLENFNVSNTKIGYAHIEGLEHINLPRRLKTLDVSFALLPPNLLMLFPGVKQFSNASYNYNKLKQVDFISMVLSTKILNFTKIIPDETIIRFENVTFFVDNPPIWKVEELILNNNNLDRLNCQVVFGNHTFPRLRKLEMYNNALEFIHPSILAIAPNLQILDLSDNFLNAMSNENFPLFKTLLNTLTQLKTIYMSNNGLRSLPQGFFEDNIHLEFIDLSRNWLDRVTFDLQALKNLQELNLCDNNIVRLGQDSFTNLNRLQPFVNGTHTAKFEITFHLNPITCIECEDQNSIGWLLKAIQLNFTTYQDLQCTLGNDIQEEITDATLDKLQTLCQRKVNIQVSAITAGCVFLLIIILSIIIYKRRRIMKQRKNRAAILSSLQDGESAYEFVAFLGYSSADENFVNAYVVNQMNQTLQQMTGTNRNLICTGDHYFRPGCMVHDEIATCLERVCVMVVLVSDSYCSSIYCQSEFDQANLYQKPIVLMLRGNVNEDMMPPAMKQLYRRNARILWSEENGEYVLKTSWENVCSSILDLIK